MYVCVRAYDTQLLFPAVYVCGGCMGVCVCTEGEKESVVSREGHTGHCMAVKLQHLLHTRATLH